jgi:hypothetical protein
MTQVKVNNNGLYYNFKIAKEERKCILGCVIPKDTKYLIVYDVTTAPNGNKTANTCTIWCKNHYKYCEFCRTPYLNLNKRFCSDVCCEEAFRRESIDAEENEFYGRGADDSGW